MLFVANTVVAQEGKTSTVRLKSGIVVEGQILEQASDGSVKVKTGEGDVFIYRANEISRIETDDMETKVKKQASQGLGTFRGYKGIVEIGGVYDFDWSAGGGQFTFVNGYNFGAHFFLGVGVGVNYIDYGGGESIVSIPVFLNVRTPFIKNSRVSPFFGLSAGYNLTVASNLIGIYSYNDGGHYRESSSTGVYIEPMLGCDFRINRKKAVTLCVSGVIIPANILPKAPIYGVAVKVGFSF